MLFRSKLSKGNSPLACIACWAVFVVGVFYAIVTGTGLLNLPSPDNPIGQPYFRLMELCILAIAPLMLIAVAGVYAFAEQNDRLASMMATGFILITTAITSCVHLTILVMGPVAETQIPSIFSFRWPSVVYVSDILAWDWFFGLAMLFLAFVFRGRSTSLWLLMLLSGVLSLLGLVGLINGNMSIRNIGIIGYGVVAPVAFLRLGFWFRQNG